MQQQQHHDAANPWLTSSTKSQDGRLAYACYFFLGAGVLAPWNALIMAADYWASVYPGRHVDRTFTVCYLPTCLLFIGLFIRFPRLIGQRLRILAGFAGFFILMLAVPMLDIVMVGTEAEGPPEAYALLLVIVLLVGVLDGFCQGAIFGDAAALPSQYTHAVVGGTASSGALISVIRIITKASLPPNRAGLRRSTIIYFGISAVISLVCFGIYSAVLPRLCVVALWRKRRASAAPSLASTRRGSLDGAAAAEAGAQRPHGDDRGAVGECPVRRGGSRDGGPSGLDALAAAVHVAAPAASSAAPSGRDPRQHPWAVDQEPLIEHDAISPRPAELAGLPEAAPVPWEQGECHGGAGAAPGWRACLSSVWQLALSIMFIYVVTLAIFPGVLAEDTHHNAMGDWYPLMLMTLFNFSDLTGKNVPLPSRGFRHRTLLLWSIARVAFLPLFLIATRLGAPAAVVAVLCVALGVSNGYLTALTMTSAHDTATSIAAADMLENMMVFCLVLGLLIGAILGWAWIL